MREAPHQVRFLLDQAGMGNQRVGVEAEAALRERDPGHRNAFGDELEAVVEVEGDAGIDRLVGDELGDSSIGGHLDDLFLVEIGDFGDRTPLLLSRALELDAEFPAVEVGQLLDSRIGRENDSARQLLRHDADRHERQVATVRYQDDVGAGQSELGGAVDDELGGHSRAFTGKDFYVDPFRSEEALLLTEVVWCVLRTGHPVQAEADPVGCRCGVRPCQGEHEGETDDYAFHLRVSWLTKVSHMVSGVSEISVCQDMVTASSSRMTRKNNTPSRLSTKMPANMTGVSSEILAYSIT